MICIEATIFFFFVFPAYCFTAFALSANASPVH